MEHGPINGTEERILLGINILVGRLRLLGYIHSSYFGYDGGSVGFLAHVAFALVKFEICSARRRAISPNILFCLQGRVHEQIL